MADGYVIICANSIDVEYDCENCTAEEAQVVANNLNTPDGGSSINGGNCNSYAYMVVPNDGSGVVTGVDVISEISDEDKIQGGSIGIKDVKDNFNINLSSVTFKKSSDLGNKRFTRESFDNNFSNLTKTIKKCFDVESSCKK